MDVQLETLSNLRCKLKVTIPAEVFNAEYEKTVKKQKGTIKINGFRSGKAPKSLLEKRYKDAFRADAVENLIPEYVNKAIKEKNLDPAYQPEVQNLKMELGEPLYFEAEFETVPKIDVDFEALFELEKPALTVNEDDVVEEVERLQRQHGKKEEVETKAQFGNIVKVSILEQDGKPLPENEEPIEFYLHKDNNQLQELIDALIGTQKGDIKETSLKAKTDEADSDDSDKKDITLKFLVKDVIKITPAEFNEDFFKLVDPSGKINSADALKDSIKKNFLEETANAKLHELQTKVRDDVYKKLDIELPQKIVENRKNSILHDLKNTENQKQVYNQRFANQDAGADNKESREPYEIKSDEELEKAALESATKDLQIMYFVDDLVRKNNLKVNQQELIKAFISECYYRKLGDPKKYMQTNPGKNMLQYLEQALVETSAVNFMIRKKYGNDFIPLPEDGTNKATT